MNAIGPVPVAAPDHETEEPEHVHLTADHSDPEVKKLAGLIGWRRVHAIAASGQRAVETAEELGS